MTDGKLTLGGERVFGLDILRASAIFFVLFAHGSTILPPPFNFNGFDGVAIFFALSGYLIGGILLQMMAESKLLGFFDLLRFWRRRWFRTLPNYYFILLILLWISPGPGEPYNHAKYVFLVQNVTSAIPNFFSESWSLVIEEWFYLLVPIVFVLLTRCMKWDMRKTVFFTCVALIALTTGLRVYRAWHMGIDNLNDVADWLGQTVVTRFDGLMFGIYAAYAKFYRTRFWMYPRTTFVIALILILGPRPFALFMSPVFFAKYFYYSFAAVSSACMIPLMARIRKGSGLIGRCITYISLISYSLYLVNSSLVRHYLLNFFTGSPFALYGWFWTLSFALATLLYFVYERPMTALRDRFEG